MPRAGKSVGSGKRAGPRGNPDSPGRQHSSTSAEDGGARRPCASRGRQRPQPAPGVRSPCGARLAVQPQGWRGGGPGGEQGEERGGEGGGERGGERGREAAH